MANESKKGRNEEQRKPEQGRKTPENKEGRKPGKDKPMKGQRS